MMADGAYEAFVAAMKEYREVFGERFPSALFHGDEKGVAEAIRECVAAGKPYDPYEGIPEEERDGILF